MDLRQTGCGTVEHKCSICDIFANTDDNLSAVSASDQINQIYELMTQCRHWDELNKGKLNLHNHFAGLDTMSDTSEENTIRTLIYWSERDRLYDLARMLQDLLDS